MALARVSRSNLFQVAVRLMIWGPGHDMAAARSRAITSLPNLSAF